jgi:hypothetical protein
MVHLPVSYSLLELGPLLIHVVIHLQLHKQLMLQDKTAPVTSLTGEFSSIVLLLQYFAVATATDAVVLLSHSTAQI